MRSKALSHCMTGKRGGLFFFIKLQTLYRLTRNSLRDLFTLCVTSNFWQPKFGKVNEEQSLYVRVTTSTCHSHYDDVMVTDLL